MPLRNPTSEFIQITKSPLGKTSLTRESTANGHGLRKSRSKVTFTISSNKYLSSLQMSGQKWTDTIGTEANVRLLRSAWL